MGCMGGEREKQLAKEHQWDYFNLNDFKSNSCWAPFSYGILYITLLVSIACYVLDVLTCYQMLIFDKWSGQIQPTQLVKFEITRWIFTGCILLSFLFLFYRWWKCIRAIKSGSVVASYLDPLAVRVQSVRMGGGQGWRRFLVFADLTSSKKGAEYVALFSYFSFEASLRILFAEGPRQVINGMTIYGIANSELFNNTNKHGTSPVLQFFANVKTLADGSLIRAVVFFGMCFTVFIWVISFLSLAAACILYIMFLWHHIPSGVGGLRGFCKRKVDSKLQQIVDAKIKKAFEREEKLRIKAEAKMAKTGGPAIQALKSQPTLPLLTTGADDKLPGMPMVSRADTFTTLPAYDSRPGTPSMPGQSDQFSRPGMPSRTTTTTSNNSYASSNAPLMGGAAAMGFSQPPRPYSPAQSMAGSVATAPPALGRSLTGQTQASQSSYGYGGPAPAQGRPLGPSRQNTQASQFGPDRQFTPAPSMRSYTPMGDPRSQTPMGAPRSNTPMTAPRTNTPMGDSRFVPGPPRRQNTADSYAQSQFAAPDRSDAALVVSSHSGYSRHAGVSARSEHGIEMQYRPQQAPTLSNQNFRPYSPALSVPGQGPRLPFAGPPRNFSSPSNHASSNSFDRPYAPPSRSGTAPPQQGYSAPGFNQYDGRPGPPTRSATAGPSYDEWPQHGL